MTPPPLLAALDRWVDDLAYDAGPAAPIVVQAHATRFDGADYLVLHPSQWTQRDLEHLQPGQFRDASMPVGVNAVQGVVAGLAPGLVRPDHSYPEGGVRINEERDWNNPTGRASSNAHKAAHLASMQNLYNLLRTQGGPTGERVARRLLAETRSRFRLYERGGQPSGAAEDVAYRVVTNRKTRERRVVAVPAAQVPRAPRRPLTRDELRVVQEALDRARAAARRQGLPWPPPGLLSASPSRRSRQRARRRHQPPAPRAVPRSASATIARRGSTARAPRVP